MRGSRAMDVPIHHNIRQTPMLERRVRWLELKGNLSTRKRSRVMTQMVKADTWLDRRDRKPETWHNTLCFHHKSCRTYTPCNIHDISNIYYYDYDYDI